MLETRESGCHVVIAGCDASPVFEPAPEALDEIAGAVGIAIVGGRALAAAGRRDHDLGVLPRDGGADRVAVVTAIGDQPVEATAGGPDQCRRHRHVAGVAGRDKQHAGAPNGVGQPMNFADAPAARGADVLREGPPFAPAAERCTLMLVESIATDP